ncbi:N-acetylmuramoyl-L-alanine amidase [Lentibacillus sp. JNUCC-1]|uniref:N-acetylmuramoyl-L-alanine amidase CwlD n=1 Tax=Lentibacillus sp. JNUCC-1 TaxID=2654513 RepID=UPI0012E8A8AA|nr:N-acetylmuramoyl-L-alanine amidase CwlD [Lentibacillus sp. JNUCC-1]MUV38126.1 N-acetylmuramoyl-L-alanine amidase [Lentibacillus sp. JNUCC-1]
MNRIKHIAIWLAGAVLLAVLITRPLPQTDDVFRTWSLPLTGQTIVIDPGHGGPDGGAVGKGDVQEKDIALNVAKKLRDYLQQAGAIVYLTRETDTDLAAGDTKGLSKRKSEDIRKRLAFIEEKDADFFLTIHLNAIPSPKWSGAQTFYHPTHKKSKHLASMVQSEIIRNLENTTREPLAVNTLYLLKHAEVPGSLVEIGFLSNDQEREQLVQAGYQQKMAASIYQGVLRYVTEEPEE